MVGALRKGAGSSQMGKRKGNSVLKGLLVEGVTGKAEL